MSANEARPEQITPIRDVSTTRASQELPEPRCECGFTEYLVDCTTGICVRCNRPRYGFAPAAPPTPPEIGELLQRFRDAAYVAGARGDLCEDSECSTARAAVEAEYSRVVKERDEARRDNVGYRGVIEELGRKLDVEVARVAALTEALKTVRDDYDHDSDAHKYDTGCRVCIARAALGSQDGGAK